MSETALEIVSLVIILLVMVEVTALIASVIYMYRKDHEKHDIASQERRTIIDRIERLLTARVNNFIVFNHTRNAIIEDASGYVTPDGNVKITGEPLKIEPKYFLRPVRLLVILKEGEDAGDFLGTSQ